MGISDRNGPQAAKDFMDRVLRVCDIFYIIQITGLSGQDSCGESAALNNNYITYMEFLVNLVTFDIK